MLIILVPKDRIYPISQMWNLGLRVVRGQQGAAAGLRFEPGQVSPRWMDAHILGSRVQPLNSHQVGTSLSMCGLCVRPSYFPGWVIAAPFSPALFLSTSHSPPKQLDFDASQEGVTALNDQPRVACAVHGQPNFGRDVNLHRNIQEANEARGDQVTNEIMSHSHHQVSQS